MLAVTDRDLLVIEPSVFSGAAAAATRLASGNDGVLVGTELTSASADFESLSIQSGHVAVVNGVAVEVVQRVQPTQLQVSLPRASNADGNIAPGDGTALEFQVLTFARLIDQTKIQTLRELGLDPENAQQPLSESAVMSVGPLARAIALRVIARAFEKSAAIDPTDPSLAQRAALYATQAAKAAAQAVAAIDIDGDGQTDSTRRLAVVTLVRT